MFPWPITNAIVNQASRHSVIDREAKEEAALHMNSALILRTLPGSDLNMPPTHDEELIQNKVWIRTRSDRKIGSTSGARNPRTEEVKLAKKTVYLGGLGIREPQLTPRG